MERIDGTAPSSAASDCSGADFALRAALLGLPTGGLACSRTRTQSRSLRVARCAEEGRMPKNDTSAEEARAKGICEKCKEKPLATMHYCADCMKQIRDRKRENLAKRRASG